MPSDTVSTAVTYATGWEFVEWYPPRGAAGVGSDRRTPVPLGLRHAVPPGTRRSRCDRVMAHVRDDMPFDLDGRLPTAPCGDCAARVRPA